MCAPPVTGCGAERGGPAEEEEDPLKEEEGHLEKGAAWEKLGEDEEEEVHQEGSVEVTSSLVEEEPTLEEKEVERKCNANLDTSKERTRSIRGKHRCNCSLGLTGGPPRPLGG